MVSGLWYLDLSSLTATQTFENNGGGNPEPRRRQPRALTRQDRPQTPTSGPGPPWRRWVSILCPGLPRGWDESIWEPNVWISFPYTTCACFHSSKYPQKQPINQSIQTINQSNQSISQTNKQTNKQSTPARKRTRTQTHEANGQPFLAHLERLRARPTLPHPKHQKADSM